MLDFGVARARVRADIPNVASMLQTVYSAFPVEEATGFFDIAVHLIRPRGVRGIFRRQVLLTVDGQTPFEPFEETSPLPLLEWGLNWCMIQTRNQHLMLHAGVVERDGVAIVLPATPGSGKSTLVAALMHRGYRLLSDEFGVIRLTDARVIPSVRPVALKNESIAVIRAFAPDAIIGPTFPKTRKGDVAHVGPTDASVAARTESAHVGLVLFPRYIAGEATALEPVPKARAFTKLSANAFNYAAQGPEAFKAVTRLIRDSDCFRLRYSNLDSGIAAIDALVRDVVRRRASVSPVIPSLH